MPTPFHCHGCDKPTMNREGLCDDCVRNKNKSQKGTEVVSDIHKIGGNRRRYKFYPLEKGKRG